ncbi:CD83 antigen [Festucalex cinctus]
MRTIPMTFLLMLLSRAWARSDVVHVVQTFVSANCSLPCSAKVKAGVQYLFVSWYKMQLLGDPPTLQRRGLVMRDLPYGVAERNMVLKREVVLEDTSDIVLPNVTCGDDGSYICRLYAPVGERNIEGKVVLHLSDCSDGLVGHPRMDDDDVHHVNDDVMIWVSISLILAVFSCLAVIFMLRKLRQDQKI